MKVKLELTTLTAHSQEPLKVEETILVEAAGVIITPFDSIPISVEAINWVLETIRNCTAYQQELPQFEYEAETFGEGADNFSFVEWKIDLEMIRGEARNISIRKI